MTQFNSIYFLHIPKTAGRFIREEVLYPLVPNISRSRILFLGHTLDSNPVHTGWSDEILPNTYVLSSFRHPVEQAVSYFCQRTLDWAKHVNAPDEEVDGLLTKEKMLRQMKKVPYFYENHQSKFFIYNTPWMNGVKRDYSLDPKNYQDLIYSRIDRLNLFLKVTDNPSYSIPIATRICNDLGVAFPDCEFPVNVGVLPIFSNEASKRIYSELTPGENDAILEMSSVDSDIYFNDSLFTQLGKSNGN